MLLRIMVQHVFVENLICSFMQEFHFHTTERAQQNPKNALLMTTSQDAHSDSVLFSTLPKLWRVLRNYVYLSLGEPCLYSYLQSPHA